MIFYDWLIEQADRDNIVGDLATDTIAQSKAPGNLVPVDSDKKKEWLEYLETKGDHVVEAFKDAWAEYNGDW